MRNVSINGVDVEWIIITTTTQITYEVTGLDIQYLRQTDKLMRILNDINILHAGIDADFVKS